jgi:hypothetical protein
MVDKIQNQSIDFIGDKTKQKNNFFKDDIIGIDTEFAIAELNKNYNKMINNMFAVCSKMCIKNFTSQKMNTTEQNCSENCQKKFYSTYAYGESMVRMIVEETKKADLFSNQTEVNIVENAKKKVENSKFNF